MAVLAASLVAVVLYGCCPDPCEDCPTPPPQGFGVTVSLSPPCEVSQTDVHLSRSGENNHIRWYNGTEESQTVRFPEGGWPFMEAAGDIVIEAGKHSAWYTVAESGDTGIPMNYTVFPMINPGCPPGEPAVTADP